MVNSGVYRIVNKINGKFYVGRTDVFQKRFKKHLYDLNTKRHHSSHLQNSWNKYGENNFYFEVILYTEDKNFMIQIEQKIINDYYDQKILYNVSRLAKSGGDLITDHPNIEEIKRKHSENGKRRFAEMTEEERRIYSESMKGENNPNFGNKWSDKQKQHLSDVFKEKYRTGEISPHNKGVPLSNERKKQLSIMASQRTGSKNSFFGKSHTDEAKEKIRQANLGTKPSNMLKVVIDGVLYESLAEASRQLDIHVTTILHRVNNESPIFQNWYPYDENTKEIKIHNQKLTNLPEQRIGGVYEIDGEIYVGSKELLEKFNLKSNTFSYRLKSDNFPTWKKMI